GTVYTSPHVGVNGDGTYGSGSYTTPTTGTKVTGTYNWSAVFTDTDGNNNNARDPGTSAQEQLMLTAASPKIVTTANPTGTVNVGSTAISVSDTIVVSGGYYMTPGTLTVTL